MDKTGIVSDGKSRVSLFCTLEVPNPLDSALEVLRGPGLEFSSVIKSWEDFLFHFAVGIETDELDSNAEEFEDESVEFFVREEITEVEE